MSQRGNETYRHRRGRAQRRGSGEASERDRATTRVTTREGQGQQAISFLQFTTGDEERVVALRQRRESTPSPEAGPERAGSTSRNAAVINQLEMVMPSASNGDQPPQDNTYKEDISDDDVGGDYDSAALDHTTVEDISDDEVEDDNSSSALGDAILPWKDKYQPSNLNLRPHISSGLTEYPTHRATHGGDNSQVPGHTLAPRDIESQSSNLGAASTSPSVLTEYTARVATQKKNPAYECQYIARNMSRVQDEISRNRTEIDKLRFEPPDSRSVVSWMKDRLDNAKVDSIHQDLPRAFIPCTKLYAIMDEYAIQRVLEEIAPYEQTPTSQAEIERLTRVIAPPISDLARGHDGDKQYRRVLAVLVMIRKARCISSFIHHKVDDTQMCDQAVTFELPEGEDKEKLDRAYGQFPEPCQDRKCWLRQDIRDFREKRWEVSPPFFTVYGPHGGDLSAGAQPRGQKPGIINYQLRSSDVILPFLREKRGPATNGAFSQLEFYRLHEDQHEGRRYTVHGKKHAIAVKRLEDKKSSDQPRDFTESFHSERYVLQRLTLSNKSEHLVKLLATFETPGENCPTKYHFVFEAADGTVATLWSHPSVWKDADRAALSRWVARQCHGLAEALSQFHRFQRREDDGDLKTHGMHGDIKPENVLWYRDWDVAAVEGEEALGILQIADFGLSGFHSTGTVFDVKIVSTNDYTAPETERWLCHPPASDVWALGCLFLDLATWLVDGPGACAEFAEARLSPGPIYKERRRFSTFEQVKPNLVEVTLGRKVIEHAENLHKSRKASQFVRDLIALVLHQMLVVEDLQSVTRCSPRRRDGVPRRITSGKVRDRLQRMMEDGRAHPGYHSPSRAARGFRKPHRHALYFPVTAERLREEVLATHSKVKAGMAREGN